MMPTLICLYLTGCQHMTERSNAIIQQQEQLQQSQINTWVASVQPNKIIQTNKIKFKKYKTVIGREHQSEINGFNPYYFQNIYTPNGSNPTSNSEVINYYAVKHTTCTGPSVTFIKDTLDKFCIGNHTSNTEEIPNGIDDRATYTQCRNDTFKKITNPILNCNKLPTNPIAATLTAFFYQPVLQHHVEIVNKQVCHFDNDNIMGFSSKKDVNAANKAIEEAKKHPNKTFTYFRRCFQDKGVTYQVDYLGYYDKGKLKNLNTTFNSLKLNK